MASIQVPCLEMVTMTETVNNLKLPATFLRETFYGREQTLDKETVEVGKHNRGRSTAGFSVPFQSALIVGKSERSLDRFTCPQIRIKSSLNPGDVSFDRYPGMSPFSPRTSAGYRAAVQERVTETLGFLEDDVINTEEWMASQAAFQGGISYSDPVGDSFTLDYGRPATSTVSLTGTVSEWGTATAWPEAQFNEADKILGNEWGFNVTDVILSQEAADALLQDEAVQRRLDANNFEIGALTQNNRFVREGSVRTLGNLAGITLWVYSRSLDIQGSSSPLIRPGYAEFFNRNNAASGSDRVMYYGAIADDFDAITGSGRTMGSMVINGGRAVTKRFSKAWQTQDPTSLWLMLQTRPLPMNRKPGATVSMEVVSV